jgi:hypothetical protein
VARSRPAALLLARRPTWPRTLLLAVILAAGASTKLSRCSVASGRGAIGLILVQSPVDEPSATARPVLGGAPGRSEPTSGGSAGCS